MSQYYDMTLNAHHTFPALPYSIFITLAYFYSLENFNDM